MSYKIAKGVFDILPNDELRWRQPHIWQQLEALIRSHVALFGFDEVRTPLFEATELFRRSIGGDTDIVKKEMYTFEDLGGRSMTLRPEGTAPVMRAFVEKNLSQKKNLHKFFYLAPMFRYERQQAGRYRQHHQFGVEVVGEHSPFIDVEVIQLLLTLYQKMGLKGLSLQINSIGSTETRSAFRTALRSYLKGHLSALSSDSQSRFETNPLRILDSKCAGDQKVLEGAPSILDFLDEPSKAHFEAVLEQLDHLNIPFEVNQKLVRGLDYYNDTVFEITAGELGAQNSLGGGGRYNGLIQQLGGPDTPAFGFGSGLERVIQTALAQKVFFTAATCTTLFLIPLGEEAQITCFELMHQLRVKNIRVEMDMSGKKLKVAMKRADQMGARFVAVIGENELSEKSLELKTMASGSVETISFTALEKRLAHE